MSRARKAEKSELNKLVKEINKRMSDFEDSVQKLTDLKDSLDDIDDQIAERATVNSAKMAQLNKELEDNKIRAVNKAVEELGKVIISTEELEELRTELEKVKREGKQAVQDQITKNQTVLDEKLAQALNVQQLKHECETAQLRASVETGQKEVLNHKEQMDRMSAELASQKQLTASMVPRQAATAAH